MSTSGFLTAHQITKRFAGADTLALHDVNLTVESGEFCCIIGPSGCGKSTFLRILSGLAPTTSGRVNRPDEHKLAMVFQNFALFPWLTVYDNVAFGLRMRGVSHAEIHERVSTQLAQLGLADVSQQHPKELSGGMRQRVGIARALVIEPTILFLDEPFSALDAFTADTLRKELLDIWEKTHVTIVMVTHLVEEAVELADRIVVFSPKPGTIQEIVPNHLKRPRVKRSPGFYKAVDELTAQIVLPTA